MDRVREIVERAREWARQDERVLGAFVYGSAARGDVTPLSDVDLIVVARPGRREEIWAERGQVSQALLGAPVAEAHEVPHQRPFRWRARTADLRMLDLALDEGTISMWPGLAGAMTCLLDRGNLRQQRTDWIAGHQPPAYDVAGADDETRHHGRSDSYAAAPRTRGISSHTRPPSARPPAPRVRPPHCLKKTRTPSATHLSRMPVIQRGSGRRQPRQDSPP